MSTESGATIAELVRLDLVHREQQADLPTQIFTEPTAILDAYDLAVDLTLYLRALIETMKIGDGSLDRNGTVVRPSISSAPEFAAARLRTPDEEIALLRGRTVELPAIRPAAPGDER